jgi:hypothetical protein
MSSGAAVSARELGTCAVELLRLGWEAFRAQDCELLAAAERMVDARHRSHAGEQGSLQGAVASLFQLHATVRTMIDEEVPLTERAQREINSLFERGLELLECLRDGLLTENRVLVRHVIGSGIQYAQLARDYAMAHHQRLEEGVCLPRASSVYLEMLDGLTAVEGHARKIAEGLALRLGVSQAAH